jgi:fructokinase
MTRVLVIGESLVDVVRDGGAESRHAGGSPMNVAYGLAQLGVEAQLLTRLGRDSDGALIEHHLYRAGVRLLPASLRDEPTSTAIATIGDDGAASYEFDVTWDLGSVDATADWVHVGSIGTFLEPGAAAVERYLEGTSARVSYDPNIRPALMPADARERFERIARLTSVLKLSDEDGRWLYPELDEAALLDLLLSFGPTTVAITRGAAGAIIATPDKRVDVPAVRVTVTDTVGAGDSFMAALIAELLAGTDADAAARTAIAAAAITVSRAGAQPPTRAELDALA